MPACFQLFKHGSDVPERFAEVDDAMCAHFGVTPDAERFYRSWYDIEGLGLALGHDWDKMRAINPDRADIINWLEANYTPSAWYSRG